MTATYRSDVWADSLALIRATRDRDGEAVNVLLDHCDQRVVVVQLCALIEGLEAWLPRGFIDHSLDAMQSRSTTDGGTA